MSKAEKDAVREERIMMEVVVDAYGAEEQAIGWYYYLVDNLNFPLRPAASPGAPGQRVRSCIIVLRRKQA
jgi:Calcium binding